MVTMVTIPGKSCTDCLPAIYCSWLTNNELVWISADVNKLCKRGRDNNIDTLLSGNDRTWNLWFQASYGMGDTFECTFCSQPSKQASTQGHDTIVIIKLKLWPIAGCEAQVVTHLSSRSWAKITLTELDSCTVQGLNYAEASVLCALWLALGDLYFIAFLHVGV